MTQKVFCVSGLKNSGKTHLVLALIEEFRKAGLSVGVVKHDGHGYFTDVPGTDTRRFSDMGAVCTAVFSDSKFAFHANEAVNVHDLLAMAGALDNRPDVIIIEGLKDSDFPKVEVLRRCVSQTGVCDPATVICTVSDFGFDKYPGIPDFSFSQVPAVARLILSRLC